MNVLARLGLPLAAVGIGILVLVAGLAASGYDAFDALGAMGRGAFGSADAVLSGLLPRSVPLILIGLGLGLAFSAGALNIGAEGQFYTGAIAAAWVGGRVVGLPAPVAIPAALGAALAAGALWAGVAVILRRRFGVLEVITTLLLNFVAEALVSWMVQGPMQEARHIYPQSDPVAPSARLPLVPGTRLHLGFGFALVLALLGWVVRNRTLWGLRLRAVGTNPRAAAVAGRVRPARFFAQALVLSGAMAGLSGGVELTGVSYALYQNLSPGYGFSGIAVALLARLDPLATVATGLLFAALEAGAAGMQREAGVPAVAAFVVEAVVILVVLLADVARRRAAPAAAGV